MEILIGQTAPTEQGKNPLEKSFIELENENLHISAVKRSEDGLGCVVRLFNPSSETVKNRIRFNGGIAEISDKQSPIERQVHSFELPCTENRKWASVKKVTLEELSETELSVDTNGWCDVEVTPKQIYTLKYEYHPFDLII